MEFAAALQIPAKEHYALFRVPALLLRAGPPPFVIRAAAPPGQAVWPLHRSLHPLFLLTQLHNLI